MIYLLIQAAAIALCIGCYRSIRRHAVWYYVGMIALNALFYCCIFFEMPEIIKTPLFYLIKQCMLGMALFVIVMFVAVIPQDTKTYRKLRSIRGEMSIMAWIACLGHLYYVVAIPRTVDVALRLGVVKPSMAMGLVVSIVLLVLLAVLGVTSFRFVKKRMTNRSWKAVQWWAYPFYALVYLHLMLMLWPTVSAGSRIPIATAVVYTIIFGGYLYLRIRRDKATAAAGKPAPAVETAGADDRDSVERATADKAAAELA